ncbi:hypothetical protein PXNS11_180077 [Stutzerimonas xanthomarina]|nr:hypothetical protein PXNS11_180077 [Stutzerimonas xanthomarina]
MKSCLFATFADFSTPATLKPGGMPESSCLGGFTLIDDDGRFRTNRWISVARKRNGECY